MSVSCGVNHSALTDTVVICHCVAPVSRRHLGVLCDSWAGLGEVYQNECLHETEREKRGESGAL